MPVIIVCDAGQDDRFTCEDLGNLVRLCRTDFGVEIDISIDRIRQLSAARFSQTHCVVGKIHYLGIPKRSALGLPTNEDGGPLLRGSRPAHEEGYLIYLKPSLTGDESQDLLEYARRVPQFPHQTTADQWFDESQFESYRKLGMHVAEEAFWRYQDDDTKPVANLEALFERLHSFWYPSSLAINERSSEHVKEYTRIMDLIRTKSDLAHLDHTMFELWPDNAKRLDSRDEFYVCNSLIQLMENVYADLDLEHLWQHPQAQGWMAVFGRWAQQPAFRSAWRISEPTYAERFRNFYNDRLRGRIIALPRGFVASNGADSNGEYAHETLTRLTCLIKQGVSVVHLEVRRVRSGQLVVWPSHTVKGKPLASLTLDELKNLAPVAATLTECAEGLHGRVQLYVDLKVDGIATDVATALREGDFVWREQDFVLVSAFRSMIERVRQKSPNVRTGLVVDAATLEPALDDFLDMPTDFLAPQEMTVTAAVPERA